MTDNLYVTRQRGVLYTNYQSYMREAIVTVAGTLLPVSTRGEISSFVYEVDERLEAVRPDGQQELLVAVGVDCFIEDFAAIVSFALNITCTPNIDLARRLTQATQASLGAPKLPNEYVKRVFDKEIGWAGADAGRLQSFVNNLVGLERKNFKSVMRAIRRYVHGLHRIADDPDLAYSLLVASIESLAQDFDEFAPAWEDYAQDKRQDFDKVLADAPIEVVEGIHQTILKHEHIALGRRYREFTLNHLQPSFFREEAQSEANPARRCVLPTALESAYKSRSSYVHSLRELPRILTAIPSLADIIMIEDKPVLSFHGLARIARHIIHNIVTHAPKVEHEDFNYRADLPNTVQVSLAETCWVWQPEGYGQKTARRYLNGFLRQLTSVRGGEVNAGVNDLRPIMIKIEGLVPGLAKPAQRLPLITLYVLFHHSTPPQYSQLNWVEFANKYSKDFNTPSIESLLVHMLTDQIPDWTLEQYEGIYQKYFKQRYSNNGLQYGALFEAGMTLSLAEANRQAGNESRALSLVHEAVENLPKHQGLLDFEAAISSPMLGIDWQKLLLPPEPINPVSEVVEASSEALGPADGNDIASSQDEVAQETVPESVSSVAAG